MKMALMIIDVQEEFLSDRRGSKDFEKIVDHINYSADLFHRAGLPVIIVRDIEKGDGEGRQNIQELQVESTDTEITKVFNNAFWKTDLENILNEKGVDFLVLCGNAAEYCVAATYSGAVERGYRTTLLQNGVFAVREESLLMHFYHRDLISCTVLEGIVGIEV